MFGSYGKEIGIITWYQFFILMKKVLTCQVSQQVLAKAKKKNRQIQAVQNADRPSI